MKKFTIAASILALVGGLLTATTANSATLRVPKTSYGYTALPFEPL